MTDSLKVEIKKSLKELAKNISDQPLKESIKQLEEAYEKLLIADYLEKRNSRRDSLQSKILSNLNKKLGDLENSSPLDDRKAVESSRKQQESISMTPEIKIVPHPEGPPPMPNQEPEDEVEEVEMDEPKLEKPQPVKPVVVKAAPEAAPVKKERSETLKKPATSIAEKAQAQPQQKSLHAKLAAKALNFGLNDRLAYVKHLFEGNAEDFNRVVSQINTFETWVEANDFIEEMIKPDYNWAGKEEYEERFVSHIKARFE